MSVEPPSPSFVTRVPEGDDRPREVCAACGFVNYVNPRIVVGSIVMAGEKILLCRRAIEPRRGFWTLPAGFMEEGETVEQAARREALEEATAEIEIEGLLALYSIPRISQVQLMFRARLTSEQIAPGAESLETVLLPWSDIPWTELAFPSVKWALDHFAAWRAGASGPFFNP